MDPRMLLDAGGGVDPDFLPPLGPSVSPADLLARHYARVPGGILNALAEAAEYEGNPSWAAPLREEDYLADVAVLPAAIDHLGEYDKPSRRIYIRDDLPSPRPVVEHEATHSGLLRSMPPGAFSLQAKPLRSSDENYIRYLMRPAEIDVRLAEAKRMYARITGRLVETPEDAAKAWDLYKRSYQGVGPEDAPTMQGDFQEYEKDKTLLEEMMQRMPGVVSNEGDVIRALLSAGAADA
jgi:hypothetical protein